MALNVLRGRGRGRGHRRTPVLPEPLVIGEVEQEIGACPACARPIARGAPRCPGCGTRMLIGVPARRAGVFLVLGASMGTLLGGFGAAAAISSRGVDSPAPSGAAIANPVPSPQATLAATSSPATIPSLARSALVHSGDVNVRLAVAGSDLRSALFATDLDTAEVIRLLRSVAGDAAEGADLSGRLGGWRDAASEVAQLRGFYATVRDTARQGLRWSPGDDAGYRGAATAMLDVLAGMDDIDATARDLADAAGVTLPALPADRRAVSAAP